MININSPFDGHLIRSIALTQDSEIELILQQSYSLFADINNWLTPDNRISILDNVYKIMQVKKLDLALLASEEGGKPLMDSKIEVERALEGVLIAKNHIAHLTGKEIPMGLNNASIHRKAYTHKAPVGVVYAISAFNHPINLIIHQAVSAIAAGCPVIIKPSSLTPLSCFSIMQILYEAGLPKPWAQAIICDNSTAEKVACDPRISYFSFIGSSTVGWYLRSKLSPGTKCVLEHGGAAPVIVDNNVDMEKIIPGIVRGGYYHAGQVCVSAQRLYVHQKSIKQFSKLMLEHIDKLVIGDPLQESTSVGPMISSTALNRVEEYVNEASYKGGKVLIGGKATKETCFEPTLILNPPLTASVSKEEIFGPVVSLYGYQEIDDAISMANSLPYHFQSSIYTNTIDVAFKGIRELNANTVLINDHTAFRMDWMPFGGQKESGIGCGGIPYSMDDMTYEKLAIWHSDSI